VAIREWQVRAAEGWAKRARHAFEAAKETMRRKPNQCRGCGMELLQGGRGRPPEWCDKCKGGPKWLDVKRQTALRSYYNVKGREAKARKEAESGPGGEDA
jgi:hypothetical protein